MSTLDNEPIVIGPGIAIGPGGVILDAPENEDLLNQIQQAPPLSPQQLLKTAKYYKAYPTHLQLGNHLALLAVASPDQQQAVFSEYDAWGDFFEDLLDGQGSNLAHERTEASNIQLSARWIPFSGLGLLIETLNFIESHDMMSWNFIIGAMPSPDSLPEIGKDTLP